VWVLAQVTLDLFSRSDLRVGRILPGSRAGSTLTQQVPALIELFLERGQPSVFLLVGDLAAAESRSQYVFGLDQLLDTAQDI